MSSGTRLPARARRLFRLPPSQARLLRDVDDEMRFHLEMRIAELRALGMSPDEAEAEAVRRVGDLDALRDDLVRAGMRRGRMSQVRESLSDALQDIRMACRRLSHSPTFAMAATLTLAITISATASVFALVDAVLLKAFPYRDPSRVLSIWESNPQFPQFAVAPANYLDWQAQSTASFTSLAALKYQFLTATGSGEAERLSAAAATPNYASTLGITPALGRFLAPSSAGPAEVVIGYAFWQRQFGGQSSVLGRTLTLEGHPYTIVGATPSGLPSGSFYDPDVWTRLPLDAPAQVDRGAHVIAVYGRLRDGVSEQQGERDLKTIAARLALAYPQTNKSWSVVTMPVLQQILGSVRPALTMLFAAAACVLLIGAANLANLFLVRYLARERELALRTALGATRRRVVRELVVEALTLGTIACVVGVALAFGGVRALRVLAPTTLPRLGQISVDARVVAFCVVAALTTVCLFGLVPAWHASRASLAGAVKEGRRGTSSGRHHRLQDSLVVLQMTVALILLTGAGLFVTGFEHFRRLDPGFRPEGVLTALVTPRAERYATPEKQTAFVSRLLEQLSAIPGVLGVSVSNNLPTALVWAAGFTVIGDPPPDPAHMPTTDLACVSPGYFRTMGMDLRRGRGVLATDG